MSAVRKTWFKLLTVRMFGDPAIVDLEHRIFTSVMFLVFVNGLFSTISNILIGTSIRMVIASGASAVASFLGYRASLRMKHWRILLAPVLVFFIVLLSICWITQAGTNGTIGYYFFLVVCYSVVLFRGRAKIVSLALTAASIISLLLVEFMFPAIILPYASPVQRYADVAFSMVICLAMAAAFIYVVYNEYHKERHAKDDLLLQMTAEKERVERSMREKQRLLSVVCHDIANALTILKGDISLVKLSRRADQPIERTTIDRMHYASENIEEIINSVRMMEAVEQGRLPFKLESVDLRAVFRNAEILFAERLLQRRMHIEFPQLTEHTRFVQAEPSIFANQVFNNLISNAIKFSYPGSAIIIGISRANQEITVTVTDHGIGMPADLVDRLYDLEAKTTRPGTNGEPGTGFGMRTAKSFVDLFGGRIVIVSRPEGEHPADHGTTMAVCLKSAVDIPGR